MTGAGKFGGYPDLVEVLINLGANGRTGTLFVTTLDNHSVRFVFDEGRMAACYYSHRNSYDALPLIRQIRGGKYSFAEGVSGGMANHGVPKTEDLLLALSGKEASRSSGPSESTVNDPAKLHEALKALENEFALFIGPAAIIFCSDYLKKGNHAIDEVSDLTEMVDALARHIEDPEKRMEFRQRSQAITRKVIEG